VNPDLYRTLRAVALALTRFAEGLSLSGIQTINRAFGALCGQFRSVTAARGRGGRAAETCACHASRLEWQGAGSTQPRYKPVDTAENRARNRRVEIIQVEPAGAPK